MEEKKEIRCKAGRRRSHKVRETDAKHKEKRKKEIKTRTEHPKTRTPKN